MDGCVGLVMKIVCSLIILTMLSGCWCGVEEKDTSNVSDYFSGCWAKLERRERKNIERNAEAKKTIEKTKEKNLEDTNNNQGN